MLIMLIMLMMMLLQECLQRWIKSSDIKRCELCKFPFVMQSKVNYNHDHDHGHNQNRDGDHHHHHHILVNMTIEGRQSLPHDCLTVGNSEENNKDITVIKSS